MLERLRLIDGVSEVTLQSSDQGAPAAARRRRGGCAAHEPAFTRARSRFDPLPSTSAVAAAPPSRDTTDGSGTTSATQAGSTNDRPRPHRR